MSELGDYQRTTAREVEADIERLRAELRDLRHVYGSTPDEIRLEIDRLTRALAERDAECKAHMEMRYNAARETVALRARAESAERKLTDRAQCCLTMEDALANLWRIADICPRCCNAVETERAAAVLDETLGSHAHHMKTAGGARRPAESPADYPDGSFSPSGTSLPEEAGP